MKVKLFKEYQSATPIRKNHKEMLINYYIELYEKKEKAKEKYLKDRDEFNRIDYEMAASKLHGFTIPFLVMGWKFEVMEEPVKE